MNSSAYQLDSIVYSIFQHDIQQHRPEAKHVGWMACWGRWMDEWMDGQMLGQMDEWMHAWVDG